MAGGGAAVGGPLVGGPPGPCPAALLAGPADTFAAGYFFSSNRLSIIGVSAGNGMRFKSTTSPSTTSSI